MCRRITSGTTSRPGILSCALQAGVFLTTCMSILTSSIPLLCSAGVSRQRQRHSESSTRPQGRLQLCLYPLPPQALWIHRAARLLLLHACCSFTMPLSTRFSQPRKATRLQLPHTLVIVSGLARQLILRLCEGQFANIKDLEKFYQLLRPEAVGTNFTVVSVNGTLHIHFVNYSSIICFLRRSE